MFDDLIHFIENSPVNEVVKMLKANGVKFKSDLEVSNMEKYGAELDSFGPTQDQIDEIEKIAREKGKSIKIPATFEEAMMLIEKESKEY